MGCADKRQENQRQEQRIQERSQCWWRKKAELGYMVETLKMFEFGSWREATSKACKSLTTTKWVDRMKKDEGHEFVRCRVIILSSNS